VTTVWLLAAAGPAVAGHWAANGWWDRHYNYPPRPSGYSAIVDRFGPPCNDNARFNREYWPAADDDVLYAVRFHRRLGGAEVPGWAPDEGGRSTNLDRDVRGHIGNQHLDPYVLGGIWGYDCRYKRDPDGDPEWSTHAWGIGVDFNARYEHFGHCHNHTINADVRRIFEDHRWYQLPCDRMHFQYATDY
jgi:hypothetical protein